MKSILLIIPYGSVGGMERLAYNFCNHYLEQGYEVKALKIIKLDSDIINFDQNELFLSPIDFCEMSFLKRFYFYIKIPFLIRKIIKKHKITHSISFGDMANVFSSLTFTNEYKVASIHALKSVEFTNVNFLNKVFKFAFKSSYYFFDKVVSISNDIKKDLLLNCNYKFEKNLQVIYNPHNIVQIQYLASLPIESVEEQEIFRKDTVLFLGRLTLQKAPWFLLKAFSEVLKKNPNTNLVFIGDGDINVANYLKVLIDKLNIEKNVFFLGRKSNPYQYLKHAKVLALSSYYEGTPNVIVEAIATETPIVSSNCTEGIRELMSIEKYKKTENLIDTESGIITPNFFKGILEIPNNFDFIPEELDFAKALDKVLHNDLYKSELIRNKNQLLAKFDLAQVAKQYLE